MKKLTILFASVLLIGSFLSQSSHAQLVHPFARNCVPMIVSVEGATGDSFQEGWANFDVALEAWSETLELFGYEVCGYETGPISVVITLDQSTTVSADVTFWVRPSFFGNGITLGGLMLLIEDILHK